VASSTTYGSGPAGPDSASHHLAEPQLVVVAALAISNAGANRVIADADTLQQLTALGLAHDHRPAAVQVDTDVLPSGVLFTHRGFPHP
jgi:hypothetical protein